MILAAAIAFWKGWQIHHGETAILAYGLGVLALVLGAAFDAREARSGRCAAVTLDVSSVALGSESSCQLSSFFE